MPKDKGKKGKGYLKYSVTKGAYRQGGGGGTPSVAGGVASMISNNAARSAARSDSFESKQGKRDPIGKGKVINKQAPAPEKAREKLTANRYTRTAMWFAAALLAGVLTVTSCTAPPEAGQAAALAEASAPVFDAQADAIEATNPDRAAMYREWADVLEVVAVKINVAIADGVIDENDAFREIMPFLEPEEADVLQAALLLIQPGAATPDSLLAVAQQGAPLVWPGYGLLIAGLIGAVRSVFTQKKVLTRVVSGMGVFIAENPAEFNSVRERIKLVMGDQARKAVKAAEARIEKAEQKKIAKAANAGTATPV